MFHFISSLPTNIFEGLWYVCGGVSGGKAVENTIAKPLSDPVVSKIGLIALGSAGHYSSDMYFGACHNPVNMDTKQHRSSTTRPILHGLLSFRVLFVCVFWLSRWTQVLHLKFWDLFFGCFFFYFLVHFSHSDKIIYTPLVSCWIFSMQQKRRNELFEVIRVSPFRKCSNLRKDVLLLLQWLGILVFFGVVL